MLNLYLCCISTFKLIWIFNFIQIYITLTSFYPNYTTQLSYYLHNITTKGKKMHFFPLYNWVCSEQIIHPIPDHFAQILFVRFKTFRMSGYSSIEWTVPGLTAAPAGVAPGQGCEGAGADLEA